MFLMARQYVDVWPTNRRHRWSREKLVKCE